MRTHLCSAINEFSVGQTITVCGWARARRDHGGIIFIDLRDRSGLLQLVADPQHNAELFKIAETVRNEYVIRATGVARARPEGTINKNIKSGKVELLLSDLQILNATTPPPFLPDDEGIAEETRLKHRVIDLRGAQMQFNLRRRAAMATAARNWLAANDFIEIETPMLAPATPEGARDFLVPSRLQNGAFYALPQSPQLFKQLLMVAGFERYFQIVRCFRDEDLRADRQPEFSQIDIEMSFVEEDDVMDAMEELTCAVFAAAKIELSRPFPRMTHAEATRRFGIDRPDLRNPLELSEISDLMQDIEFKVFREPAKSDNGRVAALCLPNGAKLSRKNIDDLTEFVRRYGAKGLAHIKVDSIEKGSSGLQSPIVKFIPESVLMEILKRARAQDGDIIFFGAGREDIVNASMAALRDKLAREENLLQREWKPLWITDFPLFEYDYDNKKWNARHHPFTAPRDGDEQHIPNAPQNAFARAYDITMNGVEIGGGSIRIHSPQIQLNMLKALGIEEPAAYEKFGFLLSALKSGAPPHGGIAFGLDRMAAMATGAASIRDVIAFPKTQRGQCLLTNAPSTVPEEQLKELSIKLTKSTH